MYLSGHLMRKEKFDFIDYICFQVILLVYAVSILIITITISSNVIGALIALFCIN